VPEHFLKKLLDSPDNFNYNETFMVLSVNVMAGADTTGGTLSNILYLLMRNPDAFEKLRREIDDAWAAGNLSSPVTFQQAQSLPYLQAVIQEAFRLEPVIGLVLPRIVPDGGAEICGRFFPSGSVVGICPSVVHRDKEIFGENADHFYPERWLQTDAERLKMMNRALLHFGTGRRTCMGKNVVSTASGPLLRDDRALRRVAEFA
jgi:cytochrome P450